MYDAFQKYLNLCTYIRPVQRRGFPRACFPFQRLVPIQGTYVVMVTRDADASPPLTPYPGDRSESGLSRKSRGTYMNSDATDFYIKCLMHLKNICIVQKCMLHYKNISICSTRILKMPLTYIISHYIKHFS